MRKKAPRLVIAAPSSGSGKTLVTCGLLSALKKEGAPGGGLQVRPGLHRPMFHETVLGTPSKNLDTFFAGEELTRQLFLEDVSPADLSVVEGVMGLYDGLEESRPGPAPGTWPDSGGAGHPGGGRGKVQRVCPGSYPWLYGLYGGKRIRGVIFNRVSPMRYPP